MTIEPHEVTSLNMEAMQPIFEHLFNLISRKREEKREFFQNQVSLRTYRFFESERSKNDSVFFHKKLLVLICSYPILRSYINSSKYLFVKLRNLRVKSCYGVPW